MNYSLPMNKNENLVFKSKRAAKLKNGWAGLNPGYSNMVHSTSTSKFYICILIIAPF